MSFVTECIAYGTKLIYLKNPQVFEVTMQKNHKGKSNFTIFILVMLVMLQIQESNK